LIDISIQLIDALKISLQKIFEKFRLLKSLRKSDEKVDKIVIYRCFS